ncbi:hypothetical protein [uncultured Pseudodesulfovibrio sp.]|uniref:hypothetical protein n=1 Tax=uncultured Pseudodesulfovibrio sp. TaxID=2035858 RepID=UPI0029C74EFC|nr:hypothetical protein [uncultured Pseudodesulfovibrio sp.]
MSRLCNLFFPTVVLLSVLLCGVAATAEQVDFETMAKDAKECGISSVSVDILETAVHDGKLSGGDAGRLLGRLVEVCSEKLPAFPFEEKMAEGLAKRVAPAAVERVLAAKLEDYRDAKRILTEAGKGDDTSLLVIAGEGLSNGVSTSELRAFASARGENDEKEFLVGMEMLCLLRQAGFDAALVNDTLDTGFESGSLSPEWRYFIRVALVARERGVDNASIMKAARQVLASGGVPGDVSIRLGFTSRNIGRRVN